MCEFRCSCIHCILRSTRKTEENRGKECDSSAALLRCWQLIFFIFLFIVFLCFLLTRSRFPFCFCGASTQDWHDWLGLDKFICTQDGWAQNGRKRGETMRYQRCSSPTDHPIQGTWLSSAQGMNRWQEASGDRVLHELVPRIPRVASNIRVGSVKPSESWTYHDMSTCPMMSAIRRLNVFKKWKLNLHHKTHKTFSWLVEYIRRNSRIG